MADPFPIFAQNVEKEIVKSIESLNLREKFRAIAINHYIKEKKKLDHKLEKKILKAVREKEKLFIKYQEIESQIIKGDFPLSLDSDQIKDQIHHYISGEDEKQRMKEDLQKMQEEIQQGKQHIPDYWKQVFEKCPSLKSLIQQHDLKILEAIKKIEFTRESSEDHPHNFTIIFEFDQSKISDLLKGSIVRKSFTMYNSVLPLSTEVQIDQKKIFHNDTFFAIFFEACNLEDALDRSEEDRQKIEEKMGRQFEIAQLLIQEVIPYSLEYYLGLRDDKKADKDQGKTLEQQKEEVDQKIQKKEKELKNNDNDQFKGAECSTF